MSNPITGRMFASLVAMLCMVSVTGCGEQNDMNAQLRKAFDKGKLKGLHSVLVIHRGETIIEQYFSGEDQNWGQPLGVRHHAPDELHDIRSITKSIVSFLYGIALAEGKVADPDAVLIQQFSQYRDLAEDPARRLILVRHALSMKMGTQWNEDVPHADPANSEHAMEMSADRYRYVLDRPLIHEAGKVWNYNGGATAAIAGLIEAGVGKPVDKYAEEKLFTPLGIETYEWARGRDGVPAAASGLRLTIKDLAKIGRLVLQGGKFDGKQVVPADWLKESFQPRADLETGLRYGYFWWLAPAAWGDPPSWVAGFGNGGQRLTIQPKHDLVVAVYAGNYNDPTAWKIPVGIMENFVAPAVKARLSDN